MDQDLSELERRARANPHDRELADRLDRSLLRAGRGEELGARYRLKFQCPLRFDDLEPSPDLTRRSCQRCQATVQLVRTPAALAARVAEGSCVAIPRDSLAASYLELGSSEAVTSGSEPKPPRVHGADLRFVDLDAVEVPPAALELIPPVFAHTYQVVPIAVSSAGPEALNGQRSAGFAGPRPRLEIACGPSAPATVVEDLRFMLDLQVRVAIAEPEALARALERLYPEQPGSEGWDYMGEVILAG